MKNLIAITLICCCCTFTAFAQSNYAIKGAVTDTAKKTALDGATVTVVNAKDSILQKFTYTSKGAFSIGNLKPGSYLLMVSYADYADYTEPFKLDAAKPTRDFGNLALASKAMLLNEVIIKSRAVAMKIKGDTTVFNAAAFITQKNAKVDDLLKQLPGMKVNPDGSIVFQGEQVGKLLVDGEEFFSDDPVLVSKTVRADMVANVQVYNDKSAQAKLTGVDDGQKVTTINLQLREDKKKGIFGKLEGGFGTRDYYVGQAMFSKFTPKEKISAFGSTANNGRVGLSSSDNSKFGSAGGGGIIEYSFGGNTQGVPVARDAGVHYDKKWNKDKQSINANYKLSTLENDIVGNTITQNNLPGNFNRVERNRLSHSFNRSQTPDFVLSNTLDTTSNLTLQFTGRFNTVESSSVQNSVTYRQNGVIQNSNDNINSSKGDSKFVLAYLRYTKKLKKAGRSISINGSSNVSEYKSDGYLNSILNYYDEQGDLTKTTPTDQFKDNSNDYKSIAVNITYTEPLSKTLSLSLGYGQSLNLSNNSVLSYNKSSANVYDLLDAQFSNSFKTRSVANNYITSISYRKDKFSVNLSNTLSDSRFTQTDKLLDTMLTRTFINWSPNAYASLQLTKAASINFNYYGFTNQPSITQIQPLTQNTDPLNITVGNPGLRPDFRNSYNFYYRVYQGSANRGMNFRVSYSNTINAILRSQTTQDGVNTYQFINLEGRSPFNWGANVDFYGNVTKAFISVNPSFGVNGSTFYNYINGQLNTTKSVNYRPSISVSKSADKYNYSFSVGFNYTANSTSIQQINNNSRGISSSLNLFTKLPFGFYIGEECNYEFTGKNQVFADDFHRVLLRAYMGRNFFDENLKVSVSGSDLFNQNTGYSRNGLQGSFTEERFNTIRRFVMLSVTWDFSKFSKTPSPQK
ncbi:MAG: outer membrane beta-barrel protein [Bacteroidota bacterium]